MANTFNTIFTNTWFSSILWKTNCSSGRSFFRPVTLVRTLASSTHHICFKNQHQDLAFCSWNSQSRSFCYESTASSEVNSSPYVSSSNGYPRYCRLLPCPSQNGPPRVEHLVVKEGGPVLDYISNTLDLPPPFVADLIHFGAVYYALVCPKPPPSATAEQIKTYEEVTAPSVLSRRHSIKGKTVREAQKTFRITRADEFVEPGTYLRCYEIDWRSRILAVTDSYVVLDKPAGTSVGGTTDNIQESCATFATRALGLTNSLMTTHQIDNCTEGWRKKVKKLYLALAAAPVPVGVITHYMRPINMAPRLISEDFVDRWHLCQLEVLECKKVPWPTGEIEKKYSVEDCRWPPQNFAYECKINLLTGRTHQIRAQLAACCAPIVGDSMYMPAAIGEMSNPGLNPFRKCNKSYASESEKLQKVEQWIAQHGKEPSVAIGLQACQISWDDGDHFYEAGSPWWRDNFAIL